MTATTAEALTALGSRLAAGEVGASTLAQRAVDRATGWLSGRTSRRGFLVRAGLVGTALAADPTGYVLRPGTAYASVCGPGTGRGSGWTVFCASINQGVNACPPGSVAAGWWKADGASLCGGSARYIVDCNASCSRCSTPGARAGICSSSCWSCSCTGGPKGSCDQRKNCCNAFRYGQCNTQVRQVGAVQCRVVSCTPPWVWEECSTAPATDNRTRDHNSDSLPSAWSPLTARYRAVGENGSVLGASVFREFAVTGGRAQRYQHGRISWSRATGARETVGPVSTRFVVLGGEAGSLGFPTASPVALPGGGRASRFQHGRISWSPSTRAWETRGRITVRYETDGAERGSLGLPVGAELVVGEGRVSRFQRGRIAWRADLGARLVHRPVAARVAALGAEGGPFGFPVAGEQALAGGGRVSRFERGRISSSPTTGTHGTRGPIAERYEREGGELGPLGFPVADEQTSGGVQVSEFEHGRIRHDEATGETTVEMAGASPTPAEPSPSEAPVVAEPSPSPTA